MLKMREKQALTAVIVRRYHRADKKDKGLILDEFVASTGYNRSYARRLMGLANHRDFRKKIKVTRHRSKTYAPVVMRPVLKRLWAMSNFLCGKRLEAIIPDYIRTLERDRLMGFSPVITAQLTSMSPATIDRILKPDRAKLTLKGRTLTKPGTLLKKQIPIRTFSEWNEKIPGFLEMDLVAFCGGNPGGQFIYGLDMTDVFTGWVLLEATMGRGQWGIHQAVDEAAGRLVYRLLGLDSDNGGEFINDIMCRYAILHKITFTRGRSGKKNDNCFVEQKNYTTLRTFVGYERYDTLEQLALIKQLLILVEIYVNFFQPSVRLISKIRVGANVTRKYQKPQTPYQRLLKSGILSGRQRQQLYQVYRQHNPLELKLKIDKLQIKLTQSVKRNRNTSVTI